MLKDPPDRLLFWFNVVWILMVIILIWGIAQAKVEFNKADLSSTEYFLESQFAHYRNGMEIPLQITKGSLIARAPAYLVNGRTYSTLMEKIIQCESGGDPTAQNPNSTAYGLCQFIDGTWAYVQEKWDMKLDRHSIYDQRYACKRLLKEEGTSHWVTTEWCWSK